MRSTVGGLRLQRAQDGAAAVEAALVLGVIVIPLLLGVIHWGLYFWRAQQVDTLAPAIPTGAVAGTFGCQALKDLVADSIVVVVNDLDPDTGAIDAGDVTVAVVDVSPDVGVTVDIHIETSAGSGLSSLIPLPGGGNLVADFTQRLSDVRVTDQACR